MKIEQVASENLHFRTHDVLLRYYGRTALVKRERETVPQLALEKFNRKLYLKFLTNFNTVKYVRGLKNCAYFVFEMVRIKRESCEKFDGANRCKSTFEI